MGIEGVLEEGFITTFPDSPLRSRVEAMIGTLNEEKAKVVEGFRKVDGRWLEAEEFRVNQYNIEATIKFRELQALAEDGSNFMALKAFDVILINPKPNRARTRLANRVI